VKSSIDSCEAGGLQKGGGKSWLQAATGWPWRLVLRKEREEPRVRARGKWDRTVEGDHNLVNQGERGSGGGRRGGTTTKRQVFSGGGGGGARNRSQKKKGEEKGEEIILENPKHNRTSCRSLCKKTASPTPEIKKKEADGTRKTNSKETRRNERGVKDTGQGTKNNAKKTVEVAQYRGSEKRNKIWE